jgi:hypothetical protein
MVINEAKLEEIDSRKGVYFKKIILSARTTHGYVRIFSTNCNKVAAFVPT